MSSTTVLAAGTDTGSALVGVVCGVAATLIAVLTLRHHRRALAWVQRMRRSDEDGHDFDDATTYLRRLVEKLCEHAHKPCHSANFEPLHGLRHLLEDTAQRTEAIRPELQVVVERLDRYLATVLPPVPGTGEIPASELTGRLEVAMQQEYARIDLKNAVGVAQQRIRTLRRAT
ncbi:hypothetical protein [Streptomyces sp. NPDC093990]|uniref:hypothetical protein n=1 Tax=Streptomyces sp. NPDC093990 TaxID=3155306 RepID=UPI00341FA941